MLVLSPAAAVLAGIGASRFVSRLMSYIRLPTAATKFSVPRFVSPFFVLKSLSARLREALKRRVYLLSAFSSLACQTAVLRQVRGKPSRLGQHIRGCDFSLLFLSALTRLTMSLQVQAVVVKKQRNSVSS